MPLPNTSAADEYTAPNKPQTSAVSWAAISLVADPFDVGSNFWACPRTHHGHPDEAYFRDTAQCSINWF